MASEKKFLSVRSPPATGYAQKMDTFFAKLPHDGIVAVGILAAAAALALVLQSIVHQLLLRLARKSTGPFGLLLARANGPTRFIFPLVGVESALPTVSLPENGKLIAEHILGVLIIAAIAWVLVALILLAGDITKSRYRIDIEDNLHARQVETRLDILTRASITIVIFVSAAIALTTFPAIRAIGATLLASAGLIGIMAGFAARPIFENLVAGIQIALTQPIRIDDVIVVEGEYGRVEKIGSTYVVVRLWDWRRMVLPLTYFIDKPFQNLTYTTANLIGTVMLYADYSVDIDAMRVEVSNILKAQPLWDGKIVNVSMTDAKESLMVEVRVLVSARNSSDLFDLRCHVRERLVAFLRDKGHIGQTAAAAGEADSAAPAQSVEAPPDNRVPSLR